MLWVLAFWVMALGYSRNKSGIRCLKTLRALLVRVGNKWSWFWPRVSILYHSLWNVNIVPKYSRSDLFTNLYQNFIHWTSNISLTISNSSSLNNGSVWALYLLFVIMRRARFCSLNILCHSKPQHVIPSCRWDKIKESYMSFKAENGRYIFILTFFLTIFAECELQFMNSFIVKPRKLKHETRSIFLSLIIKSGISSFVITFWWLWKTMNLVFSILRDNLLTVNQSEIFSNSESIFDEIWLTSLCAPWVNEHNGLVWFASSAYRIKFNLSLTICILFIYIRNNKGPETDPCGTPVSSSLVDEHTSWYSTSCCRCVK